MSNNLSQPYDEERGFVIFLANRMMLDGFLKKWFYTQ